MASRPWTAVRLTELEEIRALFGHGPDARGGDERDARDRVEGRRQIRRGAILGDGLEALAPVRAADGEERVAAAVHGEDARRERDGLRIRRRGERVRRRDVLDARGELPVVAEVLGAQRHRDDVRDVREVSEGILGQPNVRVGIDGSRAHAALDLVRARAGLLVDLRARVPELDLGRHVAGDRVALGVEERDALAVGSVEEIVRRNEHGSEAEALTGRAEEGHLVGAAGPDGSGLRRPVRYGKGARLGEREGRALVFDAHAEARGGGVVVTAAGERDDGSEEASEAGPAKNARSHARP